MSNADRNATLIAALQGIIRDEMKTVREEMKVEVKNAVRDEISGIKADITNLKDNVIKIESRIDTLSTRVDMISSGLSSLSDDFRTYVNQNTTVQEYANEEFMYNYLTYNIPTSNFVRVERYAFLNPITGRDITELDGCILINPDTSTIKQEHGSIPGFLLQSKKDAVSLAHAKQVTMLIESKHALNTPKIHTKLRQLIEIESVLKSLDTMDMSKVNPKFAKMIIDHSIVAYPKIVNMIFASDDIPFNIREFLLKINSGSLTEEEYNKCIIANIRNDMLYTNLKNDKSISQQIKSDLATLLDTNDIDSIRANCVTGIYGTRSDKLLLYVPPFSDVNSSIYQHVKEKIGILQFQEVTLPYLSIGYKSYSLVKGGSITRRHRTLRRSKYTLQPKK